MIGAGHKDKDREEEVLVGVRSMRFDSQGMGPDREIEIFIG